MIANTAIWLRNNKSSFPVGVNVPEKLALKYLNLAQSSGRMLPLERTCQRNDDEPYLPNIPIKEEHIQ